MLRHADNVPLYDYEKLHIAVIQANSLRASNRCPSDPYSNAVVLSQAIWPASMLAFVILAVGEQKGQHEITSIAAAFEWPLRFVSITKDNFWSRKAAASQSQITFEKFRFQKREEMKKIVLLSSDETEVVLINSFENFHSKLFLFSKVFAKLS